MRANVGKDCTAILAEQPNISVMELAELAVIRHSQGGCQFSPNVARDAVASLRLETDTRAADLAPHLRALLSEALENLETHCPGR